MAEITFRLPTKANKFGYVEVKGDAKEFGVEHLADLQYDYLGRVYDAAVRQFQEGETAMSLSALREAVTADLGDFDAPAQPAPTKPSEGHTEPRTVHQIMSDDDVDMAAAEAILKSELGATVVSTEAPWKKEAPVCQGAAPWENAGPPPAIADLGDW